MALPQQQSEQQIPTPPKQIQLPDLKRKGEGRILAQAEVKDRFGRGIVRVQRHHQGGLARTSEWRANTADKVKITPITTYKSLESALEQVIVEKDGVVDFAMQPVSIATELLKIAGYTREQTDQALRQLDTTTDAFKRYLEKKITAYEQKAATHASLNRQESTAAAQPSTRPSLRKVRQALAPHIRTHPATPPPVESQ